MREPAPARVLDRAQCDQPRAGLLHWQTERQVGLGQPDPMVKVDDALDRPVRRPTRLREVPAGLRPASALAR